MTAENLGEQIVVVTERARNKALSVKAEEPDADRLALFLEVTEPQGFEYGYDLYFDDEGNVRPGDIVQQEGDLKVVIPQDSADSLRGATLDLSRNLLNPGWVVDNPNSPSPAVGAGVPSQELTGSVEERVQQVLEVAINPQIAAHGGRADLERVDDDGLVHLRLSGGCQGCGMAKVTLSQGIEQSLKQAVPEVTGVVDATDHAAGENPYFESAKK